MEPTRSAAPRARSPWRSLALTGAAALTLLGASSPADAAPASFHLREVERLQRAIEAAPARPEAFLQLIQLWEQRSGLQDPDTLRDRLGRLAVRPGLPPLLRSWVNWYLAAAEQRAGQVEPARTRLAALGFPPDWRVVGPFENHGGSGVEEPYAPEPEQTEGAPADATYPGAEGEIRWRTLPGLGRLGRVDLAPLFSRGDEVLAYLAVAVELPGDRDVALRVGSANGLKVFVDGRLVHDRPVVREAAFDQEAVPLRLTAGWHRLLFKVAHEEGSWTLYARLTAPDGGPLDGLRYSAERDRFFAVAPLAVAPAASVVPTAPVEPLALAEAELQAARSVRNPDPARVADRLGLIAELRLRLTPDDRRAGKEAALFRDAVTVAPRRADLQLGLGQALTEDENARRAAFEQALALAPGWVPALEALAEFHHGRSDPYRAWRADDALLRADPASIAGQLRHAERWNDLELPVQALSELTALHAASPRHPGVSAALGDQRLRMGDRRGALAALQQALPAEHLDFGLRSRVVSLLAKRNDLEGMLAQLRAVLDLWPHSLSYHLQLARLLADNGRRAVAIDHLRTLLPGFPDHPLLHEALGRQLLLAGEQQDAVAELATALRLRPQDADLRRYLRQLTPGEQTLDERWAVPAESLRRTPPPPGTAEVGAFRPLMLRAVQMHPNGMRTVFTEITLQVTDPQRLEAFQTMSIPYTPQEETVEVLTAERISPDGEVHRPTRIADSGSHGKQGGVYSDGAVRGVQFSDLQVGDLLHLRYVVDEVGSRNLFGDFFGDIVYLQERIPVARLVYVLDAPSSRPVHWGGRELPPPTVTEAGARRIYRWELTGLPQYRQEPGMPGYPEVGRYLNVSTYGSWAELARWYAELIRPQLVLDAEDRALVQRLAAGLQTEEEKIRAVHDYVLRNTRYVGIEFGIHGFKPYRASRVLRRGYGDCKDKASLIVTMLGELGIPAQLALTRTIDRGRLLPDPPTLWGFNHAIVHVPGPDLWLDGTAEFAGLRELPHQDQGAMALVVDPQTGLGQLTEVPVSPAADNHWVTAVEGELGRDGSLTFEVHERSLGQGASRMRRDYQDRSTRRARLEKMLASRFPGIEVLQAEVEQLGSLAVTPEMTFTARLPDVLRGEGDGQSLPLALFPGKLAAQLAAEGSREFERVLDYPWSEEGTVTIRLPEGLQLAAVPPEQRIEGRFGHYRISVDQPSAGTVRVRSDFLLAPRRVLPGDYPEFRRFLLDVDQLEARRLALRGSLTPPRPGTTPAPGPAPLPPAEPSTPAPPGPPPVAGTPPGAEAVPAGVVVPAAPPVAPGEVR